MIRIGVRNCVRASNQALLLSNTRKFGLFFKKGEPNPVSAVCGVRLDGENSTTVEAFDNILEAIMTYRENPQTIVNKALQTEPTFIYGHAINCLLHKLYGYSDCPQSYAKLTEWFAEHNQIREQQSTPLYYLVSSALSLYANNIVDSINYLESILLLQPTNLLATKFLQELYNQIGAYKEMRASIYRVWPCWTPSIYGYKYIFGLRSFAQTQAGDMKQAEETAQEGLNRNHEDIVSLHSVLHILEKQGRLREEMRYIRECEEVYEESLFGHHIQYHKCINHIHQGNTTFSINNYIDILSADKSLLFNNLLEKSNLLFRYQLEGQDVREQWAQLNTLWMKTSIDSPLKAVYKTMNDAFNENPIQDVQINRKPDLSMTSSAVKPLFSFMHKGANELTALQTELVSILQQSIRSYLNKDYSNVIRLLLPYMSSMSVLGEEHNYTDIFNMMVIHSCYHSKQYDLCERLLYERTCQFTNCGMDWENLSQLFKEKGDIERSKQMHELAWTLGYGQGGHNAN